MNLLFIDVLANVIIQQYFINSRCVYVITDEYNSFEYTGNIPLVNVKTEHGTIPNESNFHSFRCQEILIKSNDPAAILIDFEKRIRLEIVRFNFRKYLVLSGMKIDALINLFSLKELEFVSDILVVLPENTCQEQNFLFGLCKNETYNLFTHKYVGLKNHNEPVHLDTWFNQNTTFFNQANLYPNKLLNQEGRTLIMAVVPYKPFTIVGPNITDYQGSELSTATEFALRHNMTPFANIDNKDDNWGDIFDNWTGTGLLGNVVEDRADFGFASIYPWAVTYCFLDISKSLVRTEITCLVPAPKLAAGWLAPLYTYTYCLWIYLGFLYLLCVFMFFLINLCYIRNDVINERFRIASTEQSNFRILIDAAMIITKLLLIESLATQEIKRGFTRKYFISLILMLGLIFCITYNSGLASIMTIPRYEDPIDTVEDLANSGIHWGATQDVWIYSIQASDEPKYVKVVENFVATTEENLRKYSLAGDYAFGVERLQRENFAIASYLKADVIKNYHLMKDKLYFELSIIYTRKHSILLPYLDAFILKVFEAGLITQWQNEAVSSHMDLEVQTLVKYYSRHTRERTVVKLKWAHVEGAFAVLCLGQFMAFLALLVEMLLKKSQEARH